YNISKKYALKEVHNNYETLDNKKYEENENYTDNTKEDYRNRITSRTKGTISKIF
ncbi:2181_t:CDS:1, partial [Funneliformis caledonium]